METIRTKLLASIYVIPEVVQFYAVEVALWVGYIPATNGRNSNRQLLRRLAHNEFLVKGNDEVFHLELRAARNGVGGIEQVDHIFM